jgi:hypothetical protein
MSTKFTTTLASAGFADIAPELSDTESSGDEESESE